MPADIIDAIDIPYRSILDATDKHCSKNTYVSAAKLAKKTVIEARARARSTTRGTRCRFCAELRTSSVDPVIQSILERRWEERRRCIEAGVPLAATVMMGGLPEALSRCPRKQAVRQIDAVQGQRHSDRS